MQNNWFLNVCNFATPTPFGSVSCFVVGICMSNYNLNSLLIHQAYYSKGYQWYLIHSKVFGSIWKIGRYPIKVSVKNRQIPYQSVRGPSVKIGLDRLILFFARVFVHTTSRIHQKCDIIFTYVWSKCVRKCVLRICSYAPEKFDQLRPCIWAGMLEYLHFHCDSLNEPLHLRCGPYLHEQIDLSHTHIRAIWAG